MSYVWIGDCQRAEIKCHHYEEHLFDVLTIEVGDAELSLHFDRNIKTDDPLRTFIKKIEEQLERVGSVPAGSTHNGVGE